MDTLATIPAPQLQELHMDPPGPMPGDGDGFLLDALDAGAARRARRRGRPGLGLAAGVRRAAPPRRRARPARTPPTGRWRRWTASSRCSASACRWAPARWTRSARSSAGCATRSSPWNGGRAFLNFAEQELDTETAFGADAYARLRAAKRAYDPADLFRANHRIRVA